MKKAYKKKLPKYWLGTRMPTSLGYQPNQGIGGAKFSSERGESLEPELKAAKANVIPNALNKFSWSILPTINTFYAPNGGGLSSRTTPTTAATTASAVANTALNSQWGQIGAQMAQQGGNSSAGIAGRAIQNVADKGGFTAGETAAKTATSGIGKALSALGVVQGVGQGVSDWIHQGDHRSARDMVNTLTTNTYTSDQGNSYKELAGFNAQAERDYESTQKLSKNVNNTINGVSTALATASLLGASTGVGIPLALALGGLYGLGSWAFGFGDNSDEIEQQIKDTQDYMAMYNRQQKSAADSADVRQGFYSRDKAGNPTAALGKAPVFSGDGKTNEKQNAWGSPGETIMKKDGRSFVLPGSSFKNGKPNTDDNIRIHTESTDTIFSNFGASQYYQATGDYNGALALDEMHREMVNNKNNKNKKPGFALGTPGYLMMALPHIGGLMQNIAQLNRIKYSDRRGPQEEIADYGARQAAARVRANKIDSRPYLNIVDDLLGKHLWNIQRTPGIGMGGRMVMMDSAHRNAAKQKMDALMSINEKNIAYDNAANEMDYKTATHDMDLAHDRFWRTHAANQQINGAYETNRAMYNYNAYKMAAAAAKAYLDGRMFDQSQNYYDSMQDLYGQKVEAEKINALYNAGLIPQRNVPYINTPMADKWDRIVASGQGGIL